MSHIVRARFDHEPEHLRITGGGPSHFQGRQVQVPGYDGLRGTTMSKGHPRFTGEVLGEMDRPSMSTPLIAQVTENKSTRKLTVNAWGADPETY